MAAARAMRSPDKPCLRGWAGIATGIAFAIVFSPRAVSPEVPPYVVTVACLGGAMLALSAPLMIDRSTHTMLDRWGPGVAVAVVLGTSILLGPLGLPDALSAAIIVSAAWWAAVVVQRSPSMRVGWATLLRILLALLLFFIGGAGDEAFRELLSIPDTLEALRQRATTLNVLTAASVVAGCVLLVATVGFVSLVTGRLAGRQSAG